MSTSLLNKLLRFLTSIWGRRLSVSEVRLMADYILLYPKNLSKTEPTSQGVWCMLNLQIWKGCFLTGCSCFELSKRKRTWTSNFFPKINHLECFKDKSPPVARVLPYLTDCIICLPCSTTSFLPASWHSSTGNDVYRLWKLKFSSI